MTSVLSNICDGIVSLLEGRTGVLRTIPKGRFKHYDSSDLVKPNTMVKDPRPFVFGEISGEGEETGDLAGDYLYETRDLTVIIGYASQPNRTFELEKILSDDALLVKRCLEYPLNLSTVSGWVNSTVSITREALDSETAGAGVGYALVLRCRLLYRETL